MTSSNSNEKDSSTEKVFVLGFQPLSKTNFSKLTLNLFQKQVLFGSLLGDARLQSQSKGKIYWMRFQQNFSQHGDYCLHMFDIFKFFCSSLPDKVTRKKNNTIDLRFQNLTHSAFIEFGKMFYDNKKHLPSYDIIYSNLTPTALSYWYMDDGGIDGANPWGCSFYTHSFTDQETNMLIDILNKKYGFDAVSRDNKGSKIIILHAKDCDKFNYIVKPFTIESMLHKFPDHGHLKKMT